VVNALASRALKLGDDFTLFDGITDVDLKLDDTTRDPGANIDAVAGHFALHGERRRARREPKHGSERREREYSNDPSKSLEASHIDFSCHSNTWSRRVLRVCSAI
jgi:hypothetical protein